MIALFFIACLVGVDVIVAYTVFSGHFIENLASLLLTEGIIILLLGLMASTGGASGRTARSIKHVRVRSTLEDGIPKGYSGIEGILILIVGAVLIIVALLLLAFS